jgi:hypothetical protein
MPENPSYIDVHLKPLQALETAGTIKLFRCAAAVSKDSEAVDTCVRCAFSDRASLKDAIGSHACSLEANMRVTNGILLGNPLLLPLPS